MNDILQSVLVNLQNVGIGMLLFFMAYISNMAFSIYYNIKVLGQSFNKQKMITSIEKLIAFIIGTVLLVVVVTTLPLFSEQVGLTLPEEFVSTFSTLAIMVLPVYASCKYALAAFSKMKQVLDSHTNGNETESGENLSDETVNSYSDYSYSVSPLSSSASYAVSSTSDGEDTKNSEEVLIDGIPEDKVNKKVGNIDVPENVTLSTAEPDEVDYSLVEAEQVKDDNN